MLAVEFCGAYILGVFVGCVLGVRVHIFWVKVTDIAHRTELKFEESQAVDDGRS